MASLARLPAYWGRYKLNSTVTLDVESTIQQNEEQNQRRETEKLSLTSDTDSNPKATRRNGCHIIFDIPSEQTSNDKYTVKIPRLLPKLFNSMYYIGIFPNKYDGEGVSRTQCILQGTVFWIFSMLSIVDAIKLTKFYSVGYVNKGDLYRYTIMLYMLLRSFIRTYFVFVLVCNRCKIAKVQKTIKSIASSMENLVNLEYSNVNKMDIDCIWTITFVGAFVATIFGFTTLSSGWSFGAALRLKSYQFSQVIFIWTSNATEVIGIKATLFDDYSDWDEMPYISAFFAASWAILEYFGRIYDNVITDVLLLVVITMYELVKDFKFEDVHQHNQSEVVWRHYRQLQMISEDMDSAFGNIFKLTHFSSLITCSYFLMVLTMDDSVNVYFLLFTFTILKIGITYIIAAKTSSKNKSFRRWIQRTYLDQPYIIVGVRQLKTSIVLDELATNPIGLGSDNFHLDESFVIKFIGFLASYFMFLTESKGRSST